MASKQAIKAALRTLAANHRCQREWVTDNEPMWYKGLIHTHDSQLAQAVTDWSLKKGKAPTLSDLLGFIKSRPGYKATPGPEGCAHCDRTGWREVARHYRDERGVERAFTAAAPCDCDRGHLFHEKNGLPYYHQVIDYWTKIGSDKVFYTKANNPHLRMDQRYTKEHLDRLKRKAGEGRPKGNVMP